MYPSIRYDNNGWLRRTTLIIYMTAKGLNIDFQRTFAKIITISLAINIL